MCVPSSNVVGITVRKCEESEDTFLCLKIGRKKKEKKEKKRNTGTNKQQQPDSGIHQTATYCSRVYQVSTLKASWFLIKV